MWLRQRSLRFTDAAAPVHKQLVNVHVTAVAGESLVSEWSLAGHPDVRVTTASGVPLTVAQNRELTMETVRDQFSRLGNTPYELAGVTFESEGRLFCPVSVLNQVRREAVERLQGLQGTRVDRAMTDPLAALAALSLQQTQKKVRHADVVPAELHLLVRTPEQLEAALQCRPSSITLDYLDLFGLRGSVNRVKDSGITARVASPRILKQDEARILNFLLGLECQILVRSSGILHALRGREHGVLIGDFSLNAANSLSAAEYLSLGLSRLTPTHDLNAEQIAKLASDAGADRFEVVAFQHLPVFHTEHCVFCRFLSKGTSYRDCGRPCETHRVELRDQNGRHHPVVADVGCRNTVFGAEAQEASPHLELLRDAGIQHFRLEFVHESAKDVADIAGLFQRALAGSISFAQLNRELKMMVPAGTTQGSLFIPANYQVFPILNQPVLPPGVST